MQSLPPLVAALAQSLAADVVQTHISWVLLAPGFAYKIKKPVRLPFVDYSTLERRRHFCEAEVRLNQRLAPALYLGVSRITGSTDAPVLDGPGEPLDYAVRMRRFAAGALFSEQLAAGTLTPHAVDQFAEMLSRFHLDAPHAHRAAATHPDAPLRRALAALDGVGALLPATQRADLRQWLQAAGQALLPLWLARRAEGWVRECHGDLHLANVVSLGGEVAAFDAIEFDPALRWIDVADDVAFALMDFCARGHAGLGFRFINGWLERTGDYGCLPALRFALAYRALVRGLVEHLSEPGCAAANGYAQAALQWTRPAAPRLIITHGLPGSGKTYASQQLLQQHGAIRLRSDVERKRLFGLGMLDDSRAHGLDIYDADATRRTYQRLNDLARMALQAGFPVVLDAAFLRRGDRAQARALADALGAPFAIVACKAPAAVLRQRLQARRGDASEARVDVLAQLQSAAEPLTADEQKHLLQPAGLSAHEREGAAAC